jgi:uncharacterized protein YbjT (DUF2867 family)
MLVITAPTGQIGGQLLAHLLPGKEPIRVIVRDATKLSDSVRQRVEVVQGSRLSTCRAPLARRSGATE